MLQSDELVNKYNQKEIEEKSKRAWMFEKFNECKLALTTKIKIALHLVDKEKYKNCGCK